MRDLVEIGYAIALVSSPRPDDPARSNTIHIPLKDQPAPPGTLACCAKPGKALSPAASSFANSLRQALILGSDAQSATRQSSTAIRR